MTAATALPARLGLACVRLVPGRCVEWLGAWLACLIQPWAQKDLKRLRRNVDAVLGLPAGSAFARDFERQVLRHHAVCALDTLRMIADPRRLDVAGTEELRREIAAAEAVNRGHIIVTAHLGSWELCAYLGRRYANRPFHVLAKPPRRRWQRRLLEGMRQRMGVEVLWTDRKSLLKDMLQALKRGESVGFVMDQKPEGRKGPLVPFFGIDTEFVSGPAAMAARTGCAVIAVFCVREGVGRFRVLAETLLPGGAAAVDELELTRKMAAAIEGAVRIYPEQWTWNYKRWRERDADPGVSR